MHDRLSGNDFICINTVKASLLSNFNSLIPSNVAKTLFTAVIKRHPSPESNKQQPHSYTARIVFELTEEKGRKKKKEKESFQGDRRGGEVGSPAETKGGVWG